MMWSDRRLPNPIWHNHAVSGSAHLQMLRLLVQQDLHQRFTGNVLGAAWAVLAPLLQLLVFAVVFVHIFKARVPGLDEQGYIGFLALGMWPWFAFSEALARGSTALTDSAGLLHKVAISTWEVVTARVVGAFIIHGVGFIAVVLLLWLWRGAIHPFGLAVMLPAWIGLYLMALGLAQVTAICNVFARDTQQILGHLLTAWMFLTPILYDVTLVPEGLRRWLRINPMTDLVAGIRDPLLWGRMPSEGPWLALGIALLVLLAGWLMQRRFRLHVREFL